MNIVLIGYRGTGKTAVGKALSRRLGMSFYDIDTYIEERLGRPISDVVAGEGWAFFRAREKEAIREISSSEDSVIATGGGAVLDRDNVASLRRSRNGSFVLLKAEIETMIQRIEHDDATSQQRPRLLGSNLYEETEALLKQRMPIYEEVADFSVDTTNLAIDEVVDKITQHLDIMQRR